MSKGEIYLIPLPIHNLEEFNISSTPTINIQHINTIKVFAVENIRTSRRFLKKVNPSINIDELHFIEINKRSTNQDYNQIISIITEGNNVGVMSEAGCPGIADPGQALCEIAHQNNIKVIPLIGPSSIIMALMASGLNGQQFSFHGYLPIKDNELNNKLNKIIKLPGAHIFIETPYRNEKLLKHLIKKLHPNKKLCIATDINGKHENIITKKIADMKDIQINLKKQPTIFIFE